MCAALKKDGVKASFRMAVGRCLPLESIMFGALERTVLHKRLGPKRHLVRVRLTGGLKIDEAPVHRTVHGLRLRKLILVVPEGNTRITRVARGGLESILRIHYTLRRLTMRLTYSEVSRRKIHRLHTTTRAFRSVLGDSSVARVTRTSITFRSVVCTTASGHELVRLLGGLHRRVCECEVRCLGGGRYCPRLLGRRRAVVSTVTKRSGRLTAGFADRRVGGRTRAIINAVHRGRRGTWGVGGISQRVLCSVYVRFVFIRELRM